MSFVLMPNIIGYGGKIPIKHCISHKNNRSVPHRGRKVTWDN